MPYIPTGGDTESSGTVGGAATVGSTGSSSGTTGSTVGTGETTAATGPGTSTDGAGTGGIADEACYPGPNRDWTVCLPLVALDPLPPDYAYPPAYQDNPNYRPPIRFLDLAALDGTTQVAPNFRLDELAQESKGRYAVVQPHAVEQIQGLRDEAGPIIVNSGYRSPAYNQMVGGATYSRHMYGDAFDMDPVEVPLSTLEGLCEDAGGMLVQYPSHVHCDFRFDPVDEVFFGKASDWMPAFPMPTFHAYLEQNGQAFSAPAFGFDDGPPRRTWTALGPDGEVLARAEGPSFAPPPGTRTVVVEVGGVLFLSSADATP